MIDPSAIDRPARCPHCQLPAQMPEICSPALGAIIDASLARDWELFNAGFTLGLEMGREQPGGGGATGAEAMQLKNDEDDFPRVDGVPGIGRWDLPRKTATR